MIVRGSFGRTAKDGRGALWTGTLAPVVVILSIVAVQAVGALETDLAVRGETGISAVVHHTIRFGRESDGNTLFDYRTQGGQEVLFQFNRFTAELTVSQRHEVELLYQPLTLATQSRIPVDETITVDGVEFSGPTGDNAGDGTPLNLVYGFDFWRGTYRYRFAVNDSGYLSAGGGLQLRNARISFESSADDVRVISQDLGPVPVLSLSGRRDSRVSSLFVEGSIEGFYAPIRYLNLRDVDVIGWLYDLGVRVGVATGATSEAFVGLRAVGGGADGTGRSPSVWTVTQSEPRYTYNNLNIGALTVGARLRGR